MTRKKDIEEYMRKAKAKFKIFNDRIMVMPLPDLSATTAGGLILDMNSKNFPVGLVLGFSSGSRLAKSDAEDRIAIGDIVSYYDRNSSPVRIADIARAAHIVPDSDVFFSIPYGFKEDGEVILYGSSGPMEFEENAAQMLMGAPEMNAYTDLDPKEDEDLEPFQ